MRLPGRLAVLVALAAALACNKNQLSQTAPHLLVTPSALAFGDTPQLFPVQKTVQLENGGQALLSLSGANIDGPQAVMFKLGGSPPTQLLPGETYNLAVIFTSTAPGPAQATLHLASNDAQTPVFDVPLSGAGALTGAIAVMPASLDFGTVGEGRSKLLTLELQSLGPAPLYLASLTITPAEAGFSLVGSIATPAMLGAGQSAQLAVRYAPLPGAEATQATLSIASSDPAQPLVQVALTALFEKAPIPVVTGQLPPDPPLATSMTAPLDATVILDGSASNDPDGDLPLTFAWTLVNRPEGSAAAIGSATAPRTQITLDLAGVYTLQLVVTDSTGLPSLAPATLQIQALPAVQLEIELSWDQVRPDLDLHLLQTPQSAIGGVGDCGWTNPDPAWFSGGPDDNPRFQGDALVGYGPEIIDWKIPQGGNFGIAVVYTDANGLAPTDVDARVRVFAYGVLVAELTQPLVKQGSIWYAGTIEWPSGHVLAALPDGGTSQ